MPRFAKLITIDIPVPLQVFHDLCEHREKCKRRLRIVIDFSIDDSSKSVVDQCLNDRAACAEVFVVAARYHSCERSFHCEQIA